MNDDPIAFQVRITGRVQGVSFRDWTMREAEALGLTGWVRNDADGSVGAFVAGPADAVETMLERFRTGPRSALVSEVESSKADPAEAPPRFRITG